MDSPSQVSPELRNQSLLAPGNQLTVPAPDWEPMASVSFMWSPASLWEEWQLSVLTAAVGWAALLLLVALQPPCTFTTLLCRVQQQGHIRRFFWFDAAASHPDAAPLERLQLSTVGVLAVASAAAVPVLIVQSFGARFFECKPHPCLPLFMLNP